MPFDLYPTLVRIGVARAWSIAENSAMADACRRLRATLEAAGTPIGPLDTQIAAHALALGVTLVSHHTREFARVPGLRLANWVSPR